MDNLKQKEDFRSAVEAFGRLWQTMADEIARVIVAQDAVVADVLTALLAGGHVLLEGVPGLGKTLLVRTLGEVLDLRFSRIQFTPDLMPADIVGTQVLQEVDGQRELRFQPGPIFANLILADEINRATPKTQSAVLEAMQERTVSVARTTHPLPAPFFVLATQNPLEMEGTYPLPEAQLDRFLLKVRVEPPARRHLADILDRTTGSTIAAAARVASAGDIAAMQQTVRAVAASRQIAEFIAAAVLATSPGDAQAPASVRRGVRYGASPRGAQSVLLAAKVRALVAGRAHVNFADVENVFAPALRHRLILSFEGQAEGADPDALLAEVLAGIERTPEV